MAASRPPPTRSRVAERGQPSRHRARGLLGAPALRSPAPSSRSPPRPGAACFRWSRRPSTASTRRSRRSSGRRGGRRPGASHPACRRRSPSASPCRSCAISGASSRMSALEIDSRPVPGRRRARGRHRDHLFPAARGAAGARPPVDGSPDGPVPSRRRGPAAAGRSRPSLAATSSSMSRLEGRPPAFLWETFARAAGAARRPCRSRASSSTPPSSPSSTRSRARGSLSLDPCCSRTRSRPAGWSQPFALTVEDGYGYHLRSIPTTWLGPRSRSSAAG